MVNMRHNGVKPIMMSQQFHVFLKCNNQVSSRYIAMRSNTISNRLGPFVARGASSTLWRPGSNTTRRHCSSAYYASKCVVKCNKN